MKKVFLFCLVLLANSIVADVCPDAAREVFESGSSASSASSFFIDFARKHYGDDFDQTMSGRSAKAWSEEIVLHSKTWETEDAELFLNFLVEKIGVENTLKRMKTLPSLFGKGMNYQKFSDTYTILSHWAGKEAVIKKIKKSLNGFQYQFSEDTVVYFLNFYRNDKSDPRDMIELLKTSLADNNSEGVEVVIASLSDIFDKKGRLGDFDIKSFLSQLKEDFASLGVSADDASLFIDFMSDYLGSWNLTKTMMLKNFENFSQIDTGKFNEAVGWLKERGISEDIIKDTFRGSVKATYKVDKDKLEHITRHMQNFFGGDNAKAKKDVDSMMLKNLSAFTQINTGKFDKVVVWLREQSIPERIIKETFKENANAAYKADKEQLEHIARHMQNFFGGDNAKNNVDSMMLQNLGDFAQINTEKFDEAVDWLKERGIPEDTIKDIFKGNASAAYEANKDKLEKISRHMQNFFGGDNAKNDVDSMMLQNLSNFAKIDTGKFDGAVEWLKKRGISEASIKDTFKRNIQATYLMDKDQLEQNARHMQNFFGGNNAKKNVDSMILKNLKNFAQIDTERFDGAIDWLKERGIPEDIIKNTFKGNAGSAYRADKNKLENVARHMQNFFGGDNAKNDVNSMILQNLGEFARINTSKFNEVVDWLINERNIDEDIVKDTFRKNASAAYHADKEKLEPIARHIQNFFGGNNAKNDTDSMMLQNLGAFAQINTKKFDEAVKWLIKERRISEDTVKDAFKKNVTTAYLLDKKKLEMIAGQMDDFFSGKETDLDSLLEKINEVDCRTLTKVLCP